MISVNSQNNVQTEIVKEDETVLRENNMKKEAIGLLKGLLERMYYNNYVHK